MSDRRLVVGAALALAGCGPWEEEANATTEPEVGVVTYVIHQV